ncbi:CC166 protein, partial [Urocolius indicus]|nr:CC166 protein [Urocolius indicus]
MASKTNLMKQDSTGAGENKEDSTTNEDTSEGKSATETLVKERKLYLQKECKTLTEYMNTYMGRLEHFLQENKFLEKEAKQNQEECNTYLSYIEKQSQRCQNLLITLNDQNRTDLSRVQMQKEKLISQYAEKEKELRSNLMNMEAKLSLMTKEVEDLQRSEGPFIQLERDKKIKELKRELLFTNIQHSEQMYKIKSRLLQAKADCERDCGHKMRVLSKAADAAATPYVTQHIKKVQAENRRLRQELLRLIQCSKALKETKAQLQQQQQLLLWQKQYVQDMARTRRRMRQREGHSGSHRS